ncbi:MAG: class C sortase [[Clostridium] spiroforme]|uniref:Class C sortase n=1 Tax=Thomasclavelia spiroformis TaxID=29348 RepID=A0A943EIV0_9FIRM|nr:MULTISPECIES: class C sortase [Thomasclavelia]MBS5588756.1 class C sortase [Thomasclavelia spiroformis]
MKKSVVRIILIVGFCAGLIISLYPLISNIYSRRNQMDVIDKYQEGVEKIDKLEMINELELANAYNRQLNQAIVLTDPFDPNAIDMADDVYYDILNYTDDGVMAYINIPKIDINLPIYHGTDNEHMLKGVGHLVGTSFPVGGIDTHAVLSAHSGLSTAELFTNLADLKKGDLFYIHVLNDVLAYEVDKINVVKPDETNDLKIAPGKDYVTLVTCTPYGINSHRLLVRGHRVEYDPNLEKQESKKANNDVWFEEYIKSIISGIGIIVLIIIFIVVFKRVKKVLRR